MLLDILHTHATYEGRLYTLYQIHVTVLVLWPSVLRCICLPRQVQTILSLSAILSSEEQHTKYTPYV